MTSPTFQLEEQLSDQRSEQIAYKLTIENPSSIPIRLLSVEPRVPIGASLLEITDTSLAEANARKAELLSELNRLLSQFLIVVSESFRQTLTERMRGVFKDIFSVTGIFRFYFQLIFNQADARARLRRELDSFSFKITSASDAQSAYDLWMEKSEEYSAVRTLFLAKTEQLEQVEALMNEGGRPGLTTIEGGSFFTATYVIRFTRGILEPRKYQVGFDAIYQPCDAASALSTSTATSVRISPYPFFLTLVAILSALLGVLVKISLIETQSPFAELYVQAQSGKLLVGPIIAFVFFNIYEYTSIGKEIGISVGWRSALLIGALSGIAQDRVLAALKVLIGVTA